MKEIDVDGSGEIEFDELLGTERLVTGRYRGRPSPGGVGEHWAMLGEIALKGSSDHYN